MMEDRHSNTTEGQPLPAAKDDSAEGPNDTRACDDTLDAVEGQRMQKLRLKADFDNYRKRTLRDQGKQRREAEDALHRDHDIHVLEAVGREFDPQRHESVAMEPSNEHSEHMVTKKIRRGYMRAGTLLRLHRVVVAGGVLPPERTA